MFRNTTAMVGYIGALMIIGSVLGNGGNAFQGAVRANALEYRSFGNISQIAENSSSKQELRIVIN